MEPLYASTRPREGKRGAASVLVLTLYRHVAVDSLKLDGDRRLFDQLIAWDPTE
jgi:hypothetical protein